MKNTIPVIQKIAITGATGMLGAALTRCAVSQGVEVLCIVRKDSGRLNNLPKSDLVKVEYANINEYRHFNISGRYDVFYHFAWEKTFGKDRDDTEVQLKNIQNTLDGIYLAKCLGCKKFVGAGSQAEYGPVSVPLKPATPVAPQSGYGIAKYTAGKLGRLLCSQLGIQFNWVRIVSTFGPLDSSHTLIMYTISELLSGHSPEFTKCEQVWDYLYCDDAARAFLAIGEKGQNGKTYPLGSGDRRKLSEYLESVRDIAAPGMALQFGKKEYYPHQPMFLCADISELTQDTGWKPEISFEEGIKRIIENKYFQEY